MTTIERAEALAELQRTLRLIEDCLYHQEMSETTRLTLQASADGIRSQVLEAVA